jgi:hypothetical protein
MTILNPNIGPDWPATQLRAVTPSDTVDLVDGPCRGIHISVAGAVAVIAKDDSSAVTVANVPNGIWPVMVKRVLATGTTATGIVALY